MNGCIDISSTLINVVENKNELTKTPRGQLPRIASFQVEANMCVAAKKSKKVKDIQ